MESIKSWIGCKAGFLPFKYLGLPVCASMRRVSQWRSTIEKFSNRLSTWKAKTLSFCGRLKLVKLVLRSLPLYFISIFRAPSSILNALERVRREFF